MFLDVLFSSKNDDSAVIYYNGSIDVLSPSEAKHFSFPSFSWYLSRAFCDVDSAALYCSNKKIVEVCSSKERRDWEKLYETWSAYQRAIKASKIRVNSRNFIDLFSFDFLQEFAARRTEITKRIIETTDRPKNYELLKEVSFLLEEISTRRLNICDNAGDIKEALRAGTQVIDYNLFGTITGRLGEKPGSFPILRLPKKDRHVLCPNNDAFVELDINGAEIRTLLYLYEKEQPEYDIHQWNAENLFKGKLTRDEAKKKIFSWLYNPDNKTLSVFDRDFLVKKYWDGQTIETPFSRTIEIDDEHFVLNYLIQSTSSDLFLTQTLKVWEFLKKNRMKSYIAFLIHDCLVLDFDKNEKCKIKEIQEIFSSTPFGKYVINVAIGKNFGEMKKLPQYGKKV